MDDLAIESVDGELFEVAEARAQSRKYESGFAFLPLFWAANVWLYWPVFKSPGGDPVVKRSAFVVSSALFLPWTLAYMVGGPAVVGQRVFDAMDATKLDIWGAMTNGG